MTCPARGYASTEAGHLSEELLERYVLGVIRNDSELAPLEEHLLACPSCVARVERMEDYIWSIRSALSQSWIQVIESGG